MDSRSTAAILLVTLSVATLHALIPSHWLAFAMVGRLHRWPRKRTLSVVAIAGTGHVLVTVLIGLPLAYVGKAVLRSVPPAFEHIATAVVLVVLGIYFLIAPHGHACAGHTHERDDHSESAGDEILDLDSDPAPRRKLLTAGPTTIGALVLGMTLSPCIDLLPLYAAAATLPWSMLIAMSVIMAGVTLSVMVGLVWLTLHGLERLNLQWLDKHEHKTVGVILIGLGLLLLVT